MHVWLHFHQHNADKRKQLRNSVVTIKSYIFRKFISALLAKSHAKRERVLNLNYETKRSNGLKYTEINVQKDFRSRWELKLHQVTPGLLLLRCMIPTLAFDRNV